MPRFTDLPLDIQDVIFELKHRLELKSVLINLKFYRYIAYRDCVATRGPAYYSKHTILKSRFQKPHYKPFKYCFNISQHVFPSIDTIVSESKHVYFTAYSNVITLHALRRYDLKYLCLDNKIPFKDRDTKHILIHKLCTYKYNCST